MAVWVDPKCNKKIAYLAGVKRSVKDTAKKGAQRAEAILAAHRSSGDSRITVTHGKLDYFVNLEDRSGPEKGGPSAAAIEFGRSGGDRGATQGIHAITGAF